MHFLRPLHFHVTLAPPDLNIIFSYKTLNFRIAGAADKQSQTSKMSFHPIIVGDDDAYTTVVIYDINTAPAAAAAGHDCNNIILQAKRSIKTSLSLGAAAHAPPKGFAPARRRNFTVPIPNATFTQ